MVKEKALQGPITPEDLGAAFATQRARLRSYLRRRVTDPVLVEDLMQDIFLKATTAISADHAPKNLSGWLYAAARTRVIDYYRSTRPVTRALDENFPDTKSASDDLLHQELATCLRPLVLQLPEIYRDTLLATDFDGKTMKAFAEQQGLSLSAIKTRSSRARSMLKKQLLECCHIETAGGIVIDYHQRSPHSCDGGCTDF